MNVWFVKAAMGGNLPPLQGPVLSITSTPTVSVKVVMMALDASSATMSKSILFQCKKWSRQTGPLYHTIWESVFIQMEARLSPKDVKKLLRKDDPLILEIGAHVGNDTKRFLDEFKNLKIYCFEPDPRCIAEFKSRINDPRCVLVKAAVSDTTGTTSLFLSGGFPLNIPGWVRRLGWTRLYLALKSFVRRGSDWNASSSIVTTRSNSEDYPWLIFTKSVSVRTVKLDDWVEENGIKAVDFVWSDVQGAEKLMICGAAESLKMIKYFYMEYGETSPYPDAMTRDQTIDLMSRNSFEPVPNHCETSRIGNLLFRKKNL